MDTYIYTEQSTYKYKDRAIQTSIMGQQQRPKSAGWFLFPGSQSTRQNQSPTKRDDQQITCFFFFFFFIFYLFILGCLCASPCCCFLTFLFPPAVGIQYRPRYYCRLYSVTPHQFGSVAISFVLYYILLIVQAKRFPPQHRVLIAENGFIFLLGPRAYLCNEL